MQVSCLLLLVLSGTMRTEGGWPVWAEQEPSRIILQAILSDRGPLAPGDTLEAFNPETLEKVAYVEVASFVPKDFTAPDSTEVATMEVVGGGQPIRVPIRYRVETSNWAGDHWKPGSEQTATPQIARWPFLAMPRSYYSRLTFDPPRRLWKLRFVCSSEAGCPSTVIEDVAVGYAWARKTRVDRPPPVYVDGRPYQWHFTTDRRDPGWTVVNAASGAERGSDQLVFHSLGLGTYLVTPRGLALDARRTSCIEIQMRVDSGLGGGMLFWTTREDTVIDSRKAQSFNIGAEGGYSRYLLRLGPNREWRGMIDRLGLIPISHPARVELDWIETFSGRQAGFLRARVGPMRMKSWLVVLVTTVVMVALLLGRTWGPTAALAGITALVSLVPLDFYPDLTFKLGGERVFLLILLLVPVVAARFVERLLKRETGSALVGWPEVLLCVFLVWCVFSGLQAQEPRLFKVRLRELLLPGLLVFLLGSHGVARRWRHALLWCLLATGTVVGAIACWEYLVGRVPFYDQLYRIYARAYYDYQPVTRASASMVHPLPLSTFLLGTVPLAIGMLRSHRERFRKGLVTIGLAVMLLGLVFTFSRHAWVAALVAAGFLTVGSRRRVFAVASLSLIAILIGLVVARPGGSLGRGLYAEKRLEGLRSTAAILRAAPLRGVGLGGYAAGRELVRPDTPHPAWTTPDNSYLRVFAETGIPGGILWLGFLVTLGLDLHRGARRRSGAPIYRGLCAGVGAMTFSFLFYDGLYWLTPCFLFFLLGGLALGYARDRTAAPLAETGA
jgi:O-antigen ligase